jgi:hypothetical protein
VAEKGGGLFYRGERKILRVLRYWGIKKSCRGKGDAHVLRLRLGYLTVEDVRPGAAIATGILVAGGKGEGMVLVGRGEDELVVYLGGRRWRDLKYRGQWLGGRMAAVPSRGCLGWRIKSDMTGKNILLSYNDDCKYTLRGGC